jgi:cytochrome d ubiquinol oxidase subunit II
MPGLETLVAMAMIGSLTFYALLGGADYGGGVWDLLSRGPRAARQRDLIAHAIGPVWEANHVWLILVVVVLFTAFPQAFALISTWLHVPLVLMLIGIVARGSAFTFRTYDVEDERVKQRWGRAFAIPSLVTPVLLGVVVGAISSGVARAPGPNLPVSYFFEWAALFPVAVGLFALSLFAFLAAVYLTHETDDRELQDDFRWRAIVSELVTGVLALAVFLVAPMHLRERLAGSWWTWPLQIATALCAGATLWRLRQRRFGAARFWAGAQVTLILWGWALAQYPYLVRPVLTVAEGAAPPSTLRFLLWALGAGAAVLFPSYWYLFRVFARRSVDRLPGRS